jgi:outer membrane protein assembly factor BamB
MRETPQKPGKKSAPSDPSQAAARNQQARRTSKPLLDPHGIYGTRTAYRVRAAQRRQTIQYLGAFAAVLLVVFGTVSWLKARRIARISDLWLTSLLTPPGASPALARTRDGSWLLVPTESGQLMSVSALSGAPGTSFVTTFPLRGEPLVDGNRAFVPCDDGTLFAVDWQRGKALWSYQTRASISARPALVRMPVSAQAVAAMPPASPAPSSATASSATVTTSSPDGSPAPAAKPSARAVVVVGNDGGEILGLNAGTGQPLWRRKVDSAIGEGLVAATSTRGATPVPYVVAPLMGGLGTRGGLICLDARNGRIVWRADLRAAHLAPPAIDNGAASGKAQVFTVGDDGAVFCLDLHTGRRERGGWKTFVAPMPGAPANSAVVLRAEPLLKTYSWGRQLVVGGNDGGVRCLDAETGHLLWLFDAGAPVRCRPHAVRVPLASGAGERDLVLIGNDSPVIFTLDARSGELVSRYHTQGNASFAPVVAGDQLLNVSATGEVEGFVAPRG